MIGRMWRARGAGPVGLTGNARHADGRDQGRPRAAEALAALTLSTCPSTPIRGRGRGDKQKPLLVPGFIPCANEDLRRPA